MENICPAEGRVSACLLEICVEDPAGVRAAEAGGADRIELCSALALGGLTPSRALVASAVETRVPVHVMVRPRPGDFHHDEDEIALMTEEIGRFRDAGVQGVVVGALDRGGRLNERALERFREAAGGLKTVLHRAIDLVANPCDAVGRLVDLGYDYVLTSGGARNAFEGRGVIGEMVREAAGRITIIAGGGVKAGNAAALIRDCGVSQIHASASRSCDWSDDRIEIFGFATGPRRLTDAAMVTNLKSAMADLR